MQILYNGKVGLSSLQTAIAIEDGLIVAVGSDTDVLNLATAETETINLNGKTLWPGLIDSHLHLELFSQSLNLIDCETDTRAACLERVGAKAQTLPVGAWLLGRGWNQNLWSGGFGNAGELDGVSEGHPAFLNDKSLHTAWVNSAALRLAGIDRYTPDPAGGKLQRDPTGAPTGILFENAVRLVQSVIPPDFKEQRFLLMQAAQAQLIAYGLTAVTDFDALTSYTTLVEMQQNQALKLRVTKGIPLADLDWAIAQGIHTGAGDGCLHWGPLKLFADGALGPQTAAMLRPYENDPANRGELQLSAGEIFDFGARAGHQGISLAIHAIGDGATHEVLGGYAQLRNYEKHNHLPALAHRIEHVQLLQPADLEQLAALGITASVQPMHATSDMFMAEHYWGSRCAFAYAYRSLIKCGTRLISGSDAPVESPNPFWGIHAAVTRRRQDGQPGDEGWYGQERLTLAQALASYSSTPAQLTNIAHQTGQLTIGSNADLIVLTDDPSQVASQLLFSLKPDRVMIGGEWVYPD